MQTSKHQEELNKYFENAMKNPSTVDLNSQAQNIQNQDNEEVQDFIPLTDKFKPSDMAYHKIDDFYLIAICGENNVVFCYFEPGSNKIQSLSKPSVITFNKPGLVEELTVIKAGYIFRDTEGLKRDEVFVTAGKFGSLYIFKVLRFDKNFSLSKYESNFNAINDICFAPSDLAPHLRNLLACCSDDGSIMIWNIHLGQPIICLKPNKLPLDDVLALDWQYPGDKIVSSHLDAVRIWPINEEILQVIQESHESRESKQTVVRRDFCGTEAKINNFHDFFIDDIKVFPNNCIVSKSVDGVIIVWTYQQITPKEWYVIPFNKYFSCSSMPIQSQNKHSFFKLSVNPFDNLILAASDNKTIHLFNPAFEQSDSIKTFTLIREGTFIKNSHIIKSIILDPHLDYFLCLTSDSKLWYHKIQQLPSLNA